MTERPMTLGEIVRSEETDELTVVPNIQEIKIKCYQFALNSTQHGIYSPNEILDEANRIFDWMMDNNYQVYKKA